MISAWWLLSFVPASWLAYLFGKKLGAFQTEAAYQEYCLKVVGLLDAKNSTRARKMLCLMAAVGDKGQRKEFDEALAELKTNETD